MKTTVRLTTGAILDGEYRQAVIDMVHNQKTSVTIDKATYSLHSHFRKDDKTTITVELRHV